MFAEVGPSRIRKTKIHKSEPKKYIDVPKCKMCNSSGSICKLLMYTKEKSQWGTVGHKARQ